MAHAATGEAHTKSATALSVSHFRSFCAGTSLATRWKALIKYPSVFSSLSLCLLPPSSALSCVRRRLQVRSRKCRAPGRLRRRRPASLTPPRTNTCAICISPILLTENGRRLSTRTSPPTCGASPTRVRLNFSERIVLT